MNPPSRQGRGTKPHHILSQNERIENIPSPIHQFAPEASGLIAFNEAFQTLVTHRMNNHLLKVYGKTVRIASLYLTIQTKIDRRALKNEVPLFQNLEKLARSFFFTLHHSKLPS